MTFATQKLVPSLGLNARFEPLNNNLKTQANSNCARGDGEQSTNSQGPLVHIIAHPIQVLIMWDNHLIMPGPRSRLAMLQCSPLFFGFAVTSFVPSFSNLVYSFVSIILVSFLFVKRELNSPAKIKNILIYMRLFLK